MSKILEALTALRAIQVDQIDRDEMPESEQTQEIIDLLGLHLDKLALGQVELVEDYKVFWPDSELAGEVNLHIKLTEEGIIADVFDGDEHLGTWAITAQELTDGIHLLGFPGSFWMLKGAS